MAKTLETVRVADIHPLVYESGQEYASRDYSLKANQDYIAELAESMKLDGGVPRELVTLVRDGDIYRVKAGNCRVRAMQLLGTEECQALIDEDDTPQSALETVLLTNTKKKYEEVEESRFAQQLAMFRDDEYIGAVTGIGTERAKRIRRGMKEAGNRAEEMTFDDLEIMEEFAGDAEAVKELLECEQVSDMRSKASALRRKRLVEESRAEWREAFAEHGIEEVDDADQGKADGYNGSRYVPKVGQLDDVMESEVKGKKARGRIIDTWDSCYAYLYYEQQQTVDPEAQAREDEAVRLHDVAYRMVESMHAFMAQRIADQRKVAGAVYEKACSFLADDNERVTAYEVFEDTPAADYVNGTLPDPLWFAYAYGQMVGDRDVTNAARFAAGTGSSSYHRGEAETLAEMASLHMRDGWKPDEDMCGMLDKIAELTAEDSNDNKEDAR